MSVTIDSLDIQIRSSAGSAAKNIERLSKALSDLNANNKVNKIAKSLRKLDTANRSIEKSTGSLGVKLAVVGRSLRRVADAASKVMTDAAEWDGIQFRFGRAFGEEADIVYERVQKISNALKINKQEFMQYSSLYGSLLKGFGADDSTSSAIAVGMTELSYDIWAANNDQYKTIEDAAEALRSAITGEIEPARNAGIALSNAALQEYLDTHTQLQMSVSEMTEAQKAELRYAVMVNSAFEQGIVGAYASEMNTVEGVLRTLSQQLKTLGQTLGSLLLPLVKKIVPWVSAFVDLLNDAAKALGEMFGIKIQELQLGDPTGTKQTADNMNNMAESAKKLKQYTAGFDELNVISGSSASETDADGGTLGLNLSTLWDDSVFASASKQIDDLKQKIKDYVVEHQAMLTVVGTVTAFYVCAEAVKKLGIVFGASAFGGAAKLLTGELGAFFALLKDGSGLLPTLSATFPNLVSALSTITGLFAAPAWVTIAAIVAAIGSVFYYLYKNWQSVVDVAKAFFAESIVPKLEAIKGSWDKMKESVSGLSPVLEWLGTLVEFIGGTIFSQFAALAAGAFEAVVQVIVGFSEAISGVVQIVSGVATAIVRFITGDIRGGFESLGDMILGVEDLFWGLLDGTVGAIAAFAHGLMVGFTQTIKNTLNAGIDMINRFIGWLNSKMKFSWPGLTIAGKEIFAGGSVQLFTIPTITQRFANGGFIEDGLFTMNHGEIAGKFNNGRSVVANNEQIVEGIASGVSSANEDLIAVLYTVGRQIVDAVNAKDTSVHIDSRKITAAQTKRSRAYGV